MKSFKGLLSFQTKKSNLAIRPHSIRTELALEITALLRKPKYAGLVPNGPGPRESRGQQGSFVMTRLKIGTAIKQNNGNSHLAFLMSFDMF